MTLKIPCGRIHDESGYPMPSKHCQDGSLCPYCNAIRQLTATCIGVAARLGQISCELQMDERAEVEPLIGRLRADVARVEGRE